MFRVPLLTTFLSDLKINHFLKWNIQKYTSLYVSHVALAIFLPSASSIFKYSHFRTKTQLIEVPFKIRASIISIGLMLIFSGLSLHSQSLRINDSKDQSVIKHATVYNAQGTHQESNEYGIVDLSNFNSHDELCVTLIGYKLQCLTLGMVGADTIQMLLVSDDFIMEAITIRGSRPNQNKYSLPAHIESLKQEEIIQSAPQTTADIVGKANGVYIQKSQQGGGSPVIRGFAANRILLVLDGIRLNNAIFRSGNLQNIISVNPNGLEKIDILLGPNSLIYGSDALGGVIHMHSSKGRFNEKLKGSILTRYNSTNDEFTYSMGAQAGNSKFSWSSQFSYSTFGDLRMGSVGRESYLRDSFQVATSNLSIEADQVVVNPDPEIQVESGFKQYFMQHHLGLVIDSKSNLEYSFYYSRTSDIPRYDRLIERRNGQLRNALWNYGPQEWLMNRLAYNNVHKSSLADELSIMIAHQQYQESRIERRFQNSILRNRTEKVRILSGNIDATKKGQNQLISYGLEWVYNKVKSVASQEDQITKVISSIQTRYPNQSTWTSIASYVQSSLALNNINLSGGLRYTYVRTRAPIDNEFLDLPFSKIALDHHALSGSLGANYIPSKNIFLYSNISTGFRAPNIDDVGKVFDSEPGIVIVPNDQLEPEYIYGIEVGLQNRESQSIDVHVGAYYTYINDIITRGSFSFNGNDSIIYDGTLSEVQSLQNADDGYVWGIEAKLDYRFNSDHKVSLSVNYQKGKENTTEGNFSLRHVTPVFGFVTYAKKYDKWTVGTTLNANGSVDFRNLALSERAKPHLYARDEEGNPFSPSWWTLDARISYEPITNFQFIAGIQNLFDKRYRTYSSGIAAPGRGINISLIYGLSND